MSTATDVAVPRILKDRTRLCSAKNQPIQHVIHSKYGKRCSLSKQIPRLALLTRFRALAFCLGRLAGMKDCVGVFLNAYGLLLGFELTERRPGEEREPRFCKKPTSSLRRTVEAPKPIFHVTLMHFEIIYKPSRCTINACRETSLKPALSTLVQTPSKLANSLIKAPSPEHE